MDVENFPTANFRTTEPIDFGTVPADGEHPSNRGVSLEGEGVVEFVLVFERS